VADQTHHHESHQDHRLIFLERPRDLIAKGNGNSTEIPDGIISGRQRVQSVMVCGPCATRVTRGELGTVQGDCAA
jgi:hypothetical protein